MHADLLESATTGSQATSRQSAQSQTDLHRFRSVRTTAVARMTNVAPSPARHTSRTYTLPCGNAPRRVVPLCAVPNEPIRANRPQSARSRHTPSSTPALTPSGSHRSPTGMRRGRTPDRSSGPCTRSTRKVTANTNLQHSERRSSALRRRAIMRSETLYRGSHVVGSNYGGLPRAAPCSAGVDTADGLPVSVC